MGPERNQCLFRQMRMSVDAEVPPADLVYALEHPEQRACKVGGCALRGEQLKRFLLGALTNLSIASELDQVVAPSCAYLDTVSQTDTDIAEMSDRYPDFATMRVEQKPLPESRLRLQYPDGWEEIATAPNAVDYRAWLSDLTALTSLSCQEAGNIPDWATHPLGIANRWQRAVEIVADAAIDPEDDLTEAERIETALSIIEESVGSVGWEEVGLTFVVHNLLTGDEARIDLRELTSAPEPRDTPEA
jgi:hypothetical protein